MKIAVFHNLIPGGGKRTLIEQIKGLKKRQHRIDLYQTEKQENFMNPEEYSDNIYKYNSNINENYEGVLERLFYDLKTYTKLKYLHKNIARDIDKRNYDVVLVHADRFTQTPYLFRFLNTKSIYFCQELLRIAYEKELSFSEDVGFIKIFYEKVNRNIRRNIDFSNVQYAKCLMVNSNYTKKNVQKIYKKKGIVCYLGVNTSIFKPSKRIKFEQVLFIDSRGKLKGYDLVEKSFGLIPKNIRPSLKIFGFSDKASLIKNDKYLAKNYSISLLTLCTSYNEPFGLVPIESMACETPVLAVDEGGYRETVVDGVTGFLLSRDPRAFAEKIKYLIDNPDIARKMGKAGREHVIKNFTWEKHVDKLEKVMLELVNKNK